MFTKVGDFLLSAQAWLLQVTDKVAGFLGNALNWGTDFFKGVHT